MLLMPSHDCFEGTLYFFVVIYNVFNYITCYSEEVKLLYNSSCSVGGKHILF